jgi:hypothetical protein
MSKSFHIDESKRRIALQNAQDNWNAHQFKTVYVHREPPNAVLHVPAHKQANPYRQPSQAAIS